MRSFMIVIMFLSIFGLSGCQSSLLRTSDQVDSSQGTAMPSEPIENDPTDPASDLNKKRKSPTTRAYRATRPFGSNPQTAPAMEPNSPH